MALFFRHVPIGEHLEAAFEVILGFDGREAQNIGSPLLLHAMCVKSVNHASGHFHTHLADASYKDPIAT